MRTVEIAGMTSAPDLSGVDGNWTHCPMLAKRVL